MVQKEIIDLVQEQVQAAEESDLAHQSMALCALRSQLEKAIVQVESRMRIASYQTPSTSLSASDLSAGMQGAFHTLERSSISTHLFVSVFRILFLLDSVRKDLEVEVRSVASDSITLDVGMLGCPFRLIVKPAIRYPFIRVTRLRGFQGVETAYHFHADTLLADLKYWAAE